MPYLGGKSQAGTYQRIINLIPPHDVYIEPFLGGGAIARLKRPARLSFGVDKSPAVPTPPEGMTFVRGCGIEFLEVFEFDGTEFVYCDPPYLHSTRKSRHRYPHELSDADHTRLLRLLRSLPCSVMISGYPSALYDAALAGWNREEFEVQTRGHTWATEVLWFNYERPNVLHDLRYVGKDYRERLRIKRKIARWRARLEATSTLERAALFSALVGRHERARPLAPALALRPGVRTCGRLAIA
jgi:DNA adenine methylase